MLDFALQYQAAIDDVTSNKTAGLHQYELNDEEWGIACHLCNSLKVRLLLFLIWQLTHAWHADYVDFQRCDAILLVFSAQPCNCHSSNGPY
jgi:hypothetical protein